MKNAAYPDADGQSVPRDPQAAGTGHLGRMTDLICADSIQESVYQALRQRLQCGVFAPGESLKIRNLAAELGTSMMPVRGALQRLVAEGALEARTNRSVIVPLMTRQRFDNLTEVRLALEGLAAAAAIRRRPPALSGELSAAMRRMRAALVERNAAVYLAENSHFHLALYRAADNDILLRLIENLWLQIGPFFSRLFSDADVSLRLNDFHEEVIVALQANDPDGARQAVCDDILFHGRYLVSLLDTSARR